VAAQAARGHVNVLVLDLAAEEQVQGPLDELRLLGTTQATQGRVAFVTVGRGAVKVENRIVLAPWLVLGPWPGVAKRHTSSAPPYFRAMLKTLPLMLGWTAVLSPAMSFLNISLAAPMTVSSPLRPALPNIMALNCCSM